MILNFFITNEIYDIDYIIKLVGTSYRMICDIVTDHSVWPRTKTF